MIASRYLFDRWGACIGRLDDTGDYFDAHGRQLGQVMTGQLVVGCDGANRGRIDTQGQYWDERGVALGYLGPRVPCRAKNARLPS